MRALLLVLLSTACATNNVAELADRVRVVDSAEETRGCRQLGIVKGNAMTKTGAQQQAQRRTLYLGGNLLATWTAGGVIAGGYQLISPNVTSYRGGFIGYAFECDQMEPLAGQLTGVTFVQPLQIMVSPEKPKGCDKLGPPVEAFSDGRPGSAEDGLRRLAALVDANYVLILKDLEVDGRPALRGQPYACSVTPGRDSESGKPPVD
jgi:hypothetical protein